MTWWKYTAILLMFYALIAGMLVPLKPGLKSLNKNSFESNAPVAFNIEGYGTQFLQDDSDTRVWLKLEDGHVLRATSAKAQSNAELEVVFANVDPLPGTQKINTASVIVDHKTDKSMVLPDALFIKRVAPDTSETIEMNTASWVQQKPEGLSAKSGFYFPYRNILVETIRNIYYHVAIWFAMFILLFVSVIKSAQYLKTKDLKKDAESDALVRIGILFGLLGLATGSLWAKFTWGTFWTTDVKLNMAAVSMLIYLGYLLLRGSIGDRERRATVSSAYSIFAYLAMIPLLFIVPRMTDSLHPGNGGNPALGGEDLDNTMRLVFYPAIIGLTLTGLWMAQLKWRIEKSFLKKLGL